MNKDLLVEEIKEGIYTARIYQDADIESPREWENLGEILYTSTRYNLGDRQVEREEIQEIIERKDVIWLPVYAYIHSGITISTGNEYPYNDRWDGGMCGIIYAEREKVLKEFDKKILTKKLREKVIKCLEGEIKTFDQALTGDVYGYIITKEKVNEKCDKCGRGGETYEEDIASCWRFYGIEECRKEVEGIIKHYTKEKESA